MTNIIAAFMAVAIVLILVPNTPFPIVLGLFAGALIGLYIVERKFRRIVR